ncbi:hypothetical protein ADL12_40195 [Streptomyces regalis]|uniref:Uncharacterized protein n=1 Tax=Streptomyces regalis TaxID=68262 RepID=A0A101JAM7_9ACTN|nr:hypothetical protein ADL12_40195 [Streptomyces regalis]
MLPVDKHHWLQVSQQGALRESLHSIDIFDAQMLQYLNSSLELGIEFYNPSLFRKQYCGGVALIATIIFACCISV